MLLIFLIVNILEILYIIDVVLDVDKELLGSPMVSHVILVGYANPLTTHMIFNIHCNGKYNGRLDM